MKENQLLNKLESYNFKLLKNINYFNVIYVNGIDKSYYLNGNISLEIPYKDGLRNGLYIDYYNNRNIYQEIEYNSEIWLCEVSKFIFGELPKEIYFSKV